MQTTCVHLFKMPFCTCIELVENGCLNCILVNIFFPISNTSCNYQTIAEVEFLKYWFRSLNFTNYGVRENYHFKHSSYSHSVFLCPRSRASITFFTPPTSIVALIHADTIPANMTKVCSVSVHTTAFIPPWNHDRFVGAFKEKPTNFYHQMNTVFLREQSEFLVSQYNLIRSRTTSMETCEGKSGAQLKWKTKAKCTILLC